VPVVRVRELDCRDELLISGDQTITGCLIHETTRAFKGRTIEMARIADEGVDPLSVNVCRPSRSKDIAYGQLKKEITQRRRVEDVGIQQRRVASHGRS
jgi:hypothetical protein